MEQNKLTLGSLFDGSGGFPLGGLISGVEPLWASEIEPFPIRVTTKRLPFMKHYGDVSKLDGAKLPPVDIITFGSPCQDMSIAGKREGLDGSRSSLFYEAVRIVKEMRCATDGKYPRYIVWENVPGAFSSNKGEDFKAVLDEICSVKGYEIDPARPAKWPSAGEIVADDFSLAWRVFDAQYWGVPQRRKRIYLVADFAGGSAGKILFESEGVSGYTPQGFRSWQGTAAGAQGGSGEAGSICLNDQGGERMDITEDVTATLCAEAHHPPVVMDAAGFCTEHSAKSRSIGYEEETSPTLRTGTVPAAVYGIRSKDSYAMKSDNPHSGFYKADTSRTLDGNGGNPSCNQGGMAVVALEGNGARPSHKGSGFSEDNVSFTLNATEQHGVAYGIDRATYNMGQNAQFGIAVEEEVEPTMVAKGPGAVAHPVYTTSKAFYHTEAEEDVANTLVATDYKNPPTVLEEPYYIVRRLTPTECARLQGFPDWWCDDLGTDDPTDEEVAFWREVFETHRKVMGTSSKPKTDAQIIKWLKNPHADSAEYKMWGNGVALPCVHFVLAGIVYYSQFEG